MTKIKATFIEGDTKYHIWTEDGPACGTEGALCETRRTELPRKSVCKNCLRSSKAVYEEIPKHITAMPEGHRIMEVGETITKGCMAWEWGSGPWTKFEDLEHSQHQIGTQVRAGLVHICCPVDVQKTPETSDNADRGEPVSDKHRIAELEEERDELKRKNGLLIQTIEANRYKVGQHDLICEKFGAEKNPHNSGDTAYEAVCRIDRERDELRALVDQGAELEKKFIEQMSQSERVEYRKLKEAADSGDMQAVVESITNGRKRVAALRKERDDHMTSADDLQAKLYKALAVLEDIGEVLELGYKTGELGAWLDHKDVYLVKNAIKELKECCK